MTPYAASNTHYTPFYPDSQWTTISPAEAGLDPEGLGAAKQWLDDQVGDGRYRVVIVRGGCVVSEWNQGVDRGEQLGLASATKSIFSSMLGIVIEEGKIPSVDAKIIDYYPESMDVPEGEGPKDGRYVFEKDHDMSFRQLISNTSGYMKPGEEPGKVFHYQTYGMNILTHAIAKVHGLYDISDPEGSPGLKQLVDEKLRIPIDATWGYYLSNFDLHARARINIFGYYDGVKSSVGQRPSGLAVAQLGALEGQAAHPRSLAARSDADRARHPRELSEGAMAVWLCFLDQRLRTALAQSTARLLCRVGSGEPAHLGMPQPGSGCGAESGTVARPG